jgi:hypothetical protein
MARLPLSYLYYFPSSPKPYVEHTYLERTRTEPSWPVVNDGWWWHAVDVGAYRQEIKAPHLVAPIVAILRPIANPVGFHTLQSTPNHVVSRSVSQYHPLFLRVLGSASL